MLLNDPLERFVEASPVSVMMRAVIENLFHPERLEWLFEETAVTQYTRKLPFATVAEVMGEVVFNVQPSVNAALVERSGTRKKGQERMALSTGILRFCDRELPRPRSVEERDPSRS